MTDETKINNEVVAKMNAASLDENHIHLKSRIADLEAKLATAMSGLQEVRDYKLTVTRHWNGPSPEDELDATVPEIEAEYMQEIARLTIAELKG